MSIFSIRKKAIGIDIFDQAIEIVLLEKKGSVIKIITKARAILEPGVVSQGKIYDKRLLADVLNNLFKKNKIKLIEHKVIVFGLPDSQSYVHTFTAPKIKNGEYDDLVLEELTKIVPIPASELTAGYTVASDKKEEVNIIAVGGDRYTVTDWQDFFLSFGIKKILIAPEKTTTEIGHTVAALVGLPTIKNTKRDVKKVKISEAEYIEAIGLAISGLDRTTYKVPFFNDLLSDEEIKEKIGIVEVSNENEKVENNEEEEEITSASDDLGDEDQKIKRQKLVLAIIAIFGLIGLSLAFWYQTEQDKKQQAFIESKRANFSVVQPFTLDIAITTNDLEKSPDQAQGRLVVDVFDTQAEKDEAIAFSKIRAGQNLAVNETVWEVPVSVTSIEDKTNKKLPVYKYTVTWLIYNDSEVNALAVSKVSNALEKRNIKFAVNNVERTNIKMSDNPQVLLLTVIVSISLVENIQDAIIVL